MDGQDIRPGGDEVLDVLVRVGDHQMYVERQARHFAQRLDDRRADRDIRHEMPVHDVDMDIIRAGGLGLGDIARKICKIRRKDRRGKLDHRFHLRKA